MGENLLCIQIIIPLLMYSQQLNWMLQVKDGLQHWPTITIGLHYKSGKMNIEADALSRIPNREKEVHIDKDAVKAIANVIQIGEFSELNENPNLIIYKSATPTPKKFSNEDWVRVLYIHYGKLPLHKQRIF